MSHYVVHVALKENSNIDEIMAPYSENLEVVPYSVGKVKDLLNGINPEHIADIEKWNKLSDSEKIESWFGYKVSGEDAYSTYNPKSKWDWYTVGGRWDGGITTKSGKDVNTAKIKDIDFSCNYDYEKAKKFWDEYVLGSNRESEDYKNEWYKPEYYLSTYKDLDFYTDCLSKNYPFAFVDSAGVWHEKGEMGWFGCSTETSESIKAFNDWFEEYINSPEHADERIVLVDCHI